MYTCARYFRNNFVWFILITVLLTLSEPNILKTKNNGPQTILSCKILATANLMCKEAHAQHTMWMLHTQISCFSILLKSFSETELTNWVNFLRDRMAEMSKRAWGDWVVWSRARHSLSLFSLQRGHFVAPVHILLSADMISDFEHRLLYNIRWQNKWLVIILFFLVPSQWASRTQNTKF